MRAPLSKHIARVLRNEQAASELVSKMINALSPEGQGRVTVTVDGETKVYRAAGSARIRKESASDK